MSGRCGKRPPISTDGQCALMRLFYPQFNTRFVGGRMISVGDLNPSSLSDTYRVKFEYKADRSPKVRVISPELVPREPGGKLKHVYPGNRLCLFVPGSGEWTPQMSIAKTIVPWASEWLFYYEMWHATGEWLGGGEEPEVTPRSAKILRKWNEG